MRSIFVNILIILCIFANAIMLYMAYPLTPSIERDAILQKQSQSETVGTPKLKYITPIIGEKHNL